MAATEISLPMLSNGMASTTPNGPNTYEMPLSKVIHCRAVAKGCKEVDLVEVMSLFGNVIAIKLMPQVFQALVEFEDLESAIACVTFSHMQPILLLSRQMYVNYSKSTEINRSFSASAQSQTPSNVLLLTIVNVIYPITVNILKKICEQQNVEVLRIAIFHKNGLQAFIEFKTVEDASHILNAINGCDIYPGCCTLKIDYSKTTKLNVRANTEESFNIDIIHNEKNKILSYTSHTTGHIDPDMSTMLANAENFPAVKSILEKAMSSSSDYGAKKIHLDPNPQPNYLEQYTSPFSDLSNGHGINGGDGCVAMIFGLNNNIMNCHHLFNLFCLYGNVIKVKILVNKQGCAMVQYSDRLSTDMAIQNFNNVTLFGQLFRVAVSKHPYIMESSESTPLIDGSPSVVNFLESRDNRFRPIPGKKNDLFSRIHAPSKVLHYFNAPPTCTKERIIQLFTSFNTEIPLKQATITRPGGKSSSGLLEFSNISTATEALILANHAPIDKDIVDNHINVVGEKKPSPFIFKLAFSTSHTINK